MRPPRRSERYPSLVRVDTINGRPADEVAEGTRFDDLPCVFPTERFALGARRPDGQGDRVADAVRPRLARRRSSAPPRSGKTEALRRLAAALAGRRRARGQRRAAGVRPEEIADWTAAGVEPARDRRARRVGRRAGPGRRARGRDRPPRRGPRRRRRRADRRPRRRSTPPVARRALAAGAQPRRRRLADRHRDVAGEPVGGETTVIALDAALAATGALPGARPGRQRHAARRSCWSARPGAARSRGARRGDRAGAESSGAVAQVDVRRRVDVAA